ncbi:hypothetical protein ACK3TF_002982 [Chlorella vulgaris]
MSTVTIPAAAQPGQLACELNLRREDVQLALDKLKAGLEALLRVKGQVPAAAQRSAGPPESGLAPLPPHLLQQAAQPPASLPQQPPLPLLPQQPSMPQQPLMPQQPPASMPQQPPLPLLPQQPLPPQQLASVSQQPPMPQQPAAAAPPNQFQQPAAAPAAAVVSTAARTGGGLAWQLCWTTDAAEHSSEAISSMAYVPQIAGLPGGDGHAGWLISGSRGLLNLWEASPSGGRGGEASLMCMHSQGTDYSSACLDAERGTAMLLSASVDRSGGEWVTCHSLEVESLLAPKGRCPMPHGAAGKIPGQNCLAVASLHGFGGPLVETCVASYGGALVVWPVGTASKPGASNAAAPGSLAPKALLKAHDSLVTCLHKSAFGLLLYSGAADGKVHMFNMKEKPSRPNAVFSHQGRITGICQLNHTELLTTAGDGRMAVWDVRNAAAGPLKTAAPDTKPIVRMAVSPFADCVALATTAGLFVVDLLDAACHVTRLPCTLRSPVTAITWNAATSEVIVAGGPGEAGTISVFKQRVQGY